MLALLIPATVWATPPCDTWMVSSTPASPSVDVGLDVAVLARYDQWCGQLPPATLINRATREPVEHTTDGGATWAEFTPTRPLEPMTPYTLFYGVGANDWNDAWLDASADWFQQVDFTTGTNVTPAAGAASFGPLTVTFDSCRIAGRSVAVWHVQAVIDNDDTSGAVIEVVVDGERTDPVRPSLISRQVATSLAADAEVCVELWLRQANGVRVHQQTRCTPVDPPLASDCMPTRVPTSAQAEEPTGCTSAPTTKGWSASSFARRRTRRSTPCSP